MGAGSYDDKSGQQCPPCVCYICHDIPKRSESACLIADHLAKGIVRDKVFPNSAHDKLDGTSTLVPTHGILCDILAMVLDIACDNVLNPAVHCERHHRHRLGASADNLHDKFLL